MLSGSGSSFIAASRALGSNLSAVSCWSSLSLSYLVYKKGLAYYPPGRIGRRALSSGHNGWPTAATEQGISLAFFVCSVLPLETSILLPSCLLCRPLSRAPSFLSGFTSLLSNSTPCADPPALLWPLLHGAIHFQCGQSGVQSDCFS